jgi:multicomponent Na+:H+ antiporter subunit D
MTMVIVLLVTGLSVKSALFPFHTWVPDAYGASTPITSAVLSSLLSKSYIFLLMKMMYRAIGMEVIAAARVDDILLLYGILGMIVGSVQAIAQKDLRRMIAWSSVAQIGYIYMGMGLGNEAGMAAALVQLLSHSAAKSMLFLAADGVADARGSSLLQRLRGAGYSTPVFGVIFTVGALSLVGAPLLGGFAAKACFALAAAERDGWRMLLVFAALAVSTLLNAVYFIGAVIQLYRKPDVAEGAKARTGALSAVSVCALALVNLCLGVFASPLVQAIQSGLTLFG